VVDLSSGAGVSTAAAATRAITTELMQQVDEVHAAACAAAGDVTVPSDRLIDDDNDERALLRHVSCTDRVAFHELYLRYYRRLARFLSRVTRDSDDVEEIINDTLLIVWQHAGDFRGASRVSTWIFGIAYRRALRYARRARVRTSLSARASRHAEELVEDAASGTEARQLLDTALSALSPEHRLALVLAHFMGYSCEEIATIAKCPVNTVKTRIFHARHKLRAIISAFDVLPSFPAAG
jgi:RNA polymerase sigma-70 factor (ECF subfamily)